MMLAESLVLPRNMNQNIADIPRFQFYRTCSWDAMDPKDLIIRVLFAPGLEQRVVSYPFARSS